MARTDPRTEDVPGDDAARTTAGTIFASEREDRLLNEHQAAARLGLTVATLRRWRWARKGVPWIKVGGVAVRYAPTDLLDFVEAGRVSITDT